MGNVRLSYQDINNDGAVDQSEILQERNYYPFGLEHRGYNGNIQGVENDYITYNGKEWNEGLGLNLYEMDMRQFDPAIARWTTIDPITHFSNSTYNGFDNNPIFWSDPSGGQVEVLKDRIRFTGQDAIDAFNILTDCDKDCQKKKEEEKKQKEEANRKRMNQAMAAAHQPGAFSAAMRGGDIFNPTQEDIDSERAAFGEAVLMVSGEWALVKVFQGGKWVIKTIQARNLIKGLGGFQRASEFGIKSYKELRKLIKGTDLEAHHLIEKRFAQTLGVNPSSMEAIALTKAEHQLFTQAWRAEIGYNGSNALINTANATKQQVLDAASRVYANHPEILKAIGL